MTTAIRVNDLGKQYQLGLTHDGSIRELLNRWSARLTGRQSQQSIRSDLASGLRNQLDTSGKNFWAVRDVSFDVQQGEVVGVIGRNGAGKSTLLKLLSRICCPTTGRIELHGRVGSLLEVGTGFHPELTGRENVYMNGTILGMTKREVSRKFDEIVEFAGVGKFIDTPVKRYSSGMQVRLAFAVAAHLEPEILIVDEVLAVGDAEFRRKCLGKMQSVTGAGRAVLFVSHDMTAIQRLCSSAILLEGGKTSFVGDVKCAVDQYLQSGSAVDLQWQSNDDTEKDNAIRRVALTDQYGQIYSTLGTADCPYLEIECVIDSPHSDLRLAFAVNDQFENPIFASMPTDSGCEYPTNRGVHRYRAKFPGSILRGQRYTITVALYSQSKTTRQVLSNVLSFTPEETASEEFQAETSRVGVLQLPCQWTHRNEC